MLDEQILQNIHVPSYLFKICETFEFQSILPQLSQKRELWTCIMREH